jgi:predicted esterase
MFYFAGFNENASKYLYMFKYIFEEIDIKVKIIIPQLPKYYIPDNYMKQFGIKKNEIYSWYSYVMIKGKQELFFNYETNKLVISLINKEIETLGSSEKLIFVGFSMGGSYLLILLLLLKIKTKFNFICKSVTKLFKNVYKDDEEYQKFNDNLFYNYFSINERVVHFQLSIESITAQKKNFKNVIIRADNGKRHFFDEKVIQYFKEVLMKNIGTKAKF